MRALAALALVPLLVACASAKPTGLVVGGLPADNDISGHWSGSWVGAGLFHAVRQESLTLDMTQRGNAGYGKLVLDGAIAAESVPWEVRQQGLGGIRVFATVSGSKVKLTHEVDDRIFAADLNVAGDQMVGQVNGRSVRLILARQAPSPQSAPQQSARSAPSQMPAQVPVTAEPVPAQPEQGLATVAVAPPEESADKPQSGDQAQPRPRSEDFVAVPELKPVYFDFDKSVLRPDAADALTNNTTWLKENADTLVLIEGNCDERGTAEYNLALGDRRAKSAMDYLEANGIPKERLSTVSYGKERPVCTENTEECKNQNRRADFRIKSR
jgi:peptidoglycan-associated lipoprotein